MNFSFADESEREAALENLDSRDPSNINVVDEILNTPLTPKETPSEEPKVETPPETPPVETPVEEPKPAEPQPTPEPQATPDKLEISVEELKEKFNTDNINVAAKRLQDQLAYIETQKKQIAELQESAGRRSSAAEAKAKELEERLNKLETSPRQETNEVKQQVSRSRIADLKRELDAIERSGDPYDDDTQKRTQKVNRLLIDELSRFDSLVKKQEQLISQQNQQVSQYDSKWNEYIENQKAAQENVKRQEAYQHELKEADEFCNSYPEFKFNEGKSFAQVENEYVDWANRIGELFYGRKPQNNQELTQALRALDYKEPNLVQAVNAHGIPDKPSEDQKKYLEICDLMNYRDGQRVGPDGGVVYAERYDIATGQMVKSRHENLKAAYEARKVADGTWAKRIEEAYAKGARDILDAQNKKSEVVELDNSTGVSNVDVGVGVTPDEAAKTIETINTSLAVREAMNGNTEQLDKLNKALSVLGIEPVKI